MKKTLFALALVSSLFISATTARAEDEVRKLVVDLKAKGFTQTEWFDNLESNKIIFAPVDKFQLKVKVSNQGNRTQTQIKVRQTLPSTVTADNSVEFTIPQIAAGQDYVKDITVTIKDKAYVNKALTNNSIRFTAKSEIGTEGGDFVSFFTNNGAIVATSSGNGKGGLPATGPASTILFGSAIASALAFAGYKLRSLARGY